MSRIVTYNDSISVIPSGYSDLSNLTTSTTYPITNGYTDTASTTYAQFTLSTSTTGYLYYTFNVDGIPSNATITSITGQVKARVSSTSRVTNTVCQLYAGTTAKGSNVTFASTASTNVVTLTPGTSWTVSELENLRLRIGGTGSSSTRSKYIYFYGASITINYRYNTTEYDITVSNSATNIDSITPSNGVYQVKENDNYQIKIYGDDISGINVLDNGSNVNNQIQYIHDTIILNQIFNPSSYNSNYSSYVTNPTNFYNSTQNTSSYTSLRSSSQSQYNTWYYFDTSEIPSNATITSVSCSVRASSPNGTTGSYIGYAQLRENETLKGEQITINTTSDSIFTFSDVGTWTRSELDDINLYFSHPYGGSNRYLYIYGADLSIDYEVEGTDYIYSYTLTNINADHIIVVEDNSSPYANSKQYIKKNGSFVESTNQYVKESNSWINRTISKIFWKINGSWTETNDSMSGKTMFKIDV